jgi:hypothetical protein
VVFRILFSGQDLPHVRTPVTFLQRIPGVFEALVQYIRILVFPFHLHMEYGYPLFSIRDPKVITGILIVVSLLFLGVRAMRRRSGSIVAFSVLWFFVTLLPASQIYPIPMAYMAEHWLYIPSLGFFLLLAKVLVNMYRKRTLRGVAMVWAPSILLFYAFMTIGYTTYWQAPLALYARTLRFSPGSVRAMGSLANEYFDTGQTEKALPFYEKVIEAKPSSPVVYNNMGLAYISLGRLEEARLLYEEAIEMDPRFADFYNNLGIVYSKRGQHEKAVLFYEKARDLNPYSANAHNNLGKAYESLGRYREAVNAYRIALLHDPDNTVVRKNLKKLRRLVNAAP